MKMQIITNDPFVRSALGDALIADKPFRIETEGEKSFVVRIKNAAYDMSSPRSEFNCIIEKYETETMRP